MLRGFIHPYFDADSGGGSGSGGDPNEGFKRLLDKHNNDALQIARQLYDDNYREREQNRQLKQQLADLQGKVPSNGSVVLSADDAKALEAYRALGGVDDLKTSITNLATMRKNELLREAAEAHKFKPQVLQRLAADLDITVKETGDGKDRRKVAYVKDGDKELSLDKYAEREWSDFMPSLSAGEQQQQRGAPDINANNRGAGTPTKDQVLEAQRADLLKSGRYGGM
jgi:hypothetical protein